MTNKEILEAIAVKYNRMINIFDGDKRPYDQAVEICKLASKLDKHKLSRFECIAFKALMLAVNVAGGANEDWSGDFSICWDKYNKEYTTLTNVKYPNWADTDRKRDEFVNKFVVDISPINKEKRWCEIKGVPYNE